MRVGIDITSIMYGRGVSRYTSNLVKSLLKVPQIELALFGSSLRQKKELQAFAHTLQPAPAATHFQSWPPKLLSHLWQLGLNTIAAQDPHVSVFHSWDYLQPPDKRVPLVSTIHDLAMLKYPETAHPDILKAHHKSWQILHERNAHIITVSHAVKRDILEYLNFPSDHVHVVHSAVPRELKAAANHLTEEQHEALYQQLTQGRPYVLFVGTLEPRKNVSRLIKAWQPLQDEVDLLLVGESGWDTATLGPLPAHAHLLGRQSDANLSVLYTEAEAVVFPSLDEGFGLPILEAFSFGTPVITSNCGGMAEVAGNAAELVDPFSVASIQDGIRTVLQEGSEARQLRLQRMILRKQMFLWKNTAQHTAEVYRLAVSDHSE